MADPLETMERGLIDILRNPSEPRLLPERAIEVLSAQRRMHEDCIRGLLFREDSGKENPVFLAAVFRNDDHLRNGPWCWKIEKKELVRFARQVLESLDGGTPFETRVLAELQALRQVLKGQS